MELGGPDRLRRPVTGTFTALRRYVAFTQSRLVERRLRERIARPHPRAAHRLPRPGPDRSADESCVERPQPDPVVRRDDPADVVEPVPSSSSVIVVLFSIDPVAGAGRALRRSRSSTSTPPLLEQDPSRRPRASSRSRPSSPPWSRRPWPASGSSRDSGPKGVQADKLERRGRRHPRRVADGAAKVRATYLPINELLPSAGLIAVLGVGGHRVINGEMSIGELVAFNFYVQMLVWPLRTIGMTVAFGQRAAAALDRIDEVHERRSRRSPTRPVPRADVRTTPVRRAVRRRHASGTTPQRPCSTDFTLEIEPGTSVADRRFDRERQVDGRPAAHPVLRPADRVRSRSVVSTCATDAVADVRRSVGLVFEDTLLFHDTVAANIAFADPDAERGRRSDEPPSWPAPPTSSTTLPEGYDTILGERGFSFSGGQRQRIAIARCDRVRPVRADPRRRDQRGRSERRSTRSGRRWRR